LEKPWQQAFQSEHGVVLVNVTGIEIHRPAKKAGTFSPRRGAELVALRDESVSASSLARYVAPGSATTIYGLYERCRNVSRAAHDAWRLFILANSECVMARDFSIVDPLKHVTRSIAVVVHRNGIGMHQKSLQGRNPPCSKDCKMFIASRNLSTETMCRYFTRMEAAEIIGVYRYNRDQLLRCLPGGVPAENIQT